MKQDIHIIKSIDGKGKNEDAKNLVIFCHFDKQNKIADYVIEYLSDLYNNCDSEIIFVTNCPEISDSEVEKVKNLTSKIIIRKNIGYDFGAYFSGYSSAKNKEKYQNIVFANDSAYGPFYSVSKVFDEMNNRGLDAWAITDNCIAEYSLQSYFLCFDNKLIPFLNKFFEEFEYIDDKEKVVLEYEVKLSKKLIEQNYNISAFCNHNEVISFEFLSDDEVLKKIKNSIAKSFFYKPSLKIFFSKSYNRKLNYKKFLDLYEGPHLKCWYSLIKYFKYPFIKVNLLNNKKLTCYHSFIYKGLIKEMYPEYKIELIEKDIIRKQN